MTSLNDFELWQQVRQGDKDAFSTLFVRYHKRIYNYCYRSVGDWSRAEDLASIVFLEAWRRRDIELSTETVIPWLFGIATNVIRSARRSLRRYENALTHLPTEREAVDISEEIDYAAEKDEAARTVIDLLGKLSRRDREAFRLCAWEHFTCEEAAFILDVPVGTVKSRLFRARAKLSELYERERTLTSKEPVSRDRAERE